MRREDVEALLAKVSGMSERGIIETPILAPHLAELCRRWLAVDGADSMQVLIGPRGFGEIVCMPSLIGQRVRIVPEQGEGEG